MNEPLLEMTTEDQLHEIHRISADLEELRQIAVSPAVEAAMRAALVQLHLAGTFLGDDAIAAAFELEPVPLDHMMELDDER
jgi:hypothetical protein